MSTNYDEVLNIPFHKIVSTLADLIAGELELRGLKFSSQKEIPILRVGRFIHNPDNKLFQVSLTALFSTAARNEEFSSFKEKYLIPWAKELAIKLARPFPITTYGMEIPRNVHESYLHVGPVIVRGVTDYHIETDSLISRFDAVVSWDDK